MGIRKKILIGISLIVLCLLNVLIFFHKNPVSGEYELHMMLTGDKAQDIQIYYSSDGNLSEEMSQIKKYENAGSDQELVFSIPSGYTRIRLDMGTEPAEFMIRDLFLSYGKLQETFPGVEDSDAIQSQQIGDLDYADGVLKITTEGTDPFLWLDMPVQNLEQKLEKDCIRNNWIINILMLIFLDGGVFLVFLLRRKIMKLPMELYHNRGLIWSLSKNDFKTKYAGSYLGIVWAFVQPVVTIMVYWFVFSVGLKSGDVSNYPFVLYLVTGIVPWFFFQDALNGGTNSLIEYNYLVKKVVFKISILPIVKIVSALFVHAFFVAFSLILCAAYGYLPTLYTLQIIYYSICTFMFVLGLVYATSAIVIFFRDLTQIINIILQVGVWMTPIMWDLNMLKSYPLLMKVFKLNPMYYIVSGYRDSMLGKVWFFEHWGWTFYFWVVTVILFALGSFVFKRLKPHFADIL